MGIDSYEPRRGSKTRTKVRAWVTWGQYDNYYAWAPLMPGVNISLQFGNWRPHAYYWNTCNRVNIYDRNVSNYIINDQRHGSIINNIVIINNFNNSRDHHFFARGPEVGEVERYTNRKVDRDSYRDIGGVGRTKMNGNVLDIYRPGFQNPERGERKNRNTAPISPERKVENNPNINDRNFDRTNRVNRNNGMQNMNENRNQNPQPREYRRIAPDQVNPVRRNEQVPSAPRKEQRQNVANLPVQRSGENASSNSNQGEGRQHGGGRGHR